MKLANQRSVPKVLGTTKAHYKTEGRNKQSERGTSVDAFIYECSRRNRA